MCYFIRRSVLAVFLKQLLGTTYFKQYAQYYFSGGIDIYIISIFQVGTGNLHFVKWDKTCEINIVFVSVLYAAPTPPKTQ